MSPEELESLLTAGRGDSGSVAAMINDAHRNDGEAHSETERMTKTLRLEGVLAAVRDSWALGSGDLDIYAEKLGDGARDATWRLPIGDSGLLALFLEALPVPGVRQSLKIHALRVIGNSCADTDQNRERVVSSGHIRTIVNLLEDDSILAFVIPVLFNVCVDYEPAQLEACNAHLSAKLMDLISTRRLEHCRSFVNYICKILALLVTQGPEMKLANPASPSLLLGLATSKAYPPDLEDFCGLTTAALAYLANEQLQTEFVKSGNVELLQQAFYNSYTQFDLVRSIPEHAANLKRIWASFVSVFAEISALPAFPLIYPIGSPAARRLIAWLASPAPFFHLQTAACLALGNLSRSDEASIALIRDVFSYLHSILSHAASSCPSPSSQSPTVAPPTQLLHAVLSFLKNLAIPIANKPLLGSLLDPPQSILTRIWSTSDTIPETQFAAVSLTRLLLVNCPANIRRICTLLSQDASSPARDRSNLHTLMSVAKRTDAEPTKFEVGRAALAVCRALHTQPILTLLPDSWDDTEDGASVGLGRKSPPVGCSPPRLSYVASPASSYTTASDIASPPASAEDHDLVRRSRFYAAHASLDEIITPLLRQTRFPVLRSEAIFALAVMSRADDGFKVVFRVVSRPETCRVLIEVVTGRDVLDGDGDAAHATSTVEDVVEQLGLQEQAPAATGEMKRVDRDNGLVLLAEILRNPMAQLLPQQRRTVYEELLARGTQMMLRDRWGGEETA